MLLSIYIYTGKHAGVHVHACVLQNSITLLSIVGNAYLYYTSLCFVQSLTVNMDGLTYLVKEIAKKNNVEVPHPEEAAK